MSNKRYWQKTKGTKKFYENCLEKAGSYDAVFLKKTKRQGWMLWVPMFFMMAVTFTALGMTIYKLGGAFLSTGLTLGNTLQLIFAILLLILGVIVAVQGVKKLFEKNTEKAVA